MEKGREGYEKEEEGLRRIEREGVNGVNTVGVWDMKIGESGGEGGVGE